MRRWVPVLVLLAIAAVLLLWPRSGATYAVPAAELDAARSGLAALPVVDRGPYEEYDRSEFGDGWAEGADGCTTRDEVLRRDLTGVTLDGCRVMSGTLLDPYGGDPVQFDRSRPAEVQIDHVVALADAWRSGASSWSDAQRVEFANDPLNLLAVDGDLNQEKGSGNAATWLPPDESYRCPYAIRQIAVKQRYGLWVTHAERDALARQLRGCVVIAESAPDG
ncbi:HNH endonuclease family protein [Actinotalea sp. M2MS4P-6]|uniref:HNH endonuclease family protein n=1 Tax=Actinotalea sp. M2MS4P-6 TaxID=2983762 RepID=UPI0021E43762|nr:HNH endonuclease family protein [Actinotalea sp. M2MS4P-6]MCV2392719.1 HNH endonuclease family protein [Actinotalea sp. M2MS4P-6]